MEQAGIVLLIVLVDVIKILTTNNMKKYLLTIIAIIAVNILTAQVNADTLKADQPDSIQIVIHPNDFRKLIEDIDGNVDSKSATMRIVQFLQASVRKYLPVKPKLPAKPNKEQPK